VETVNLEIVDHVGVVVIVENDEAGHEEVVDLWIGVDQGNVNLIDNLVLTKGVV
jgi:hypothetical protein